MNAMRFYATCLITVILLSLCALLAGPTMQMLAGYNDMGVGPGVMPAISLAGVGLITVYIFFSELRRFLRLRGTPEDPQKAVETLGLPVRPFITRSVIAIALLWVYVVLWQQTGFIPATLVFTIGLGLSALPAGERTKKRVLRLVGVLGSFSVAVWWVFAYLLEVNLR